MQWVKIDTVGVSPSDFEKAVAFYMLLGFQFETDEQHLEPMTPDGSARLVIDKASLIEAVL